MPPEEDFDQNTPSEPMDIRASLMASMDAAESGTLAKVPDAPAIDTSAPDTIRDDKGRFAPKAADQVAEVPPITEQAAPAPVSLTTWKKEYQPLQEKLASGVPLLPEEAKKLADYNVQREREYSTGISVYKAEAQQSKAIQEVMVEFMPALQQNNMQPAQWIQNMGRAHSALVYGSPEQKLQTFAKLAQDYGIPLNAVAQSAAGQLDPTVAALMAELDHVKKSVGSVTQFHQKQLDQTIQQELAKFSDASKYPDFEQARPKMIQLLDSGMAEDLEAAYKLAVRMDDNLWDAQQQRQAQATAATSQATKATAAQRARQASGQVRTGSPTSANVPAPSNDLRGSLESAFAQHAGQDARV